MPSNGTATSPSETSPISPARKPSTAEKKYKCSFCARAFSRSEHRSRHERSHTKERPFKCMKCRSTFVRRDLLLRHDRTVHAKDGGVPLVSEVKRRTSAKTSPRQPHQPGSASKQSLELDTAALEQIEASSDGMVDLETAAMLMTDLHHKAMAATANQDPQLDETISPYSPDHTTLFDNTLPYLPNGLSMPQMPWENFMPQPVNEPKAHSISSSISGSHDSQLSQLSFTSNSTLQPHNTQLHPMERYPSHGDSLAPALHSLSGPMPISGPATPSGLSPFPFMEGPVSPVDYRKSPGPTQPLTEPKAPQIQSSTEFDIIRDRVQQTEAEAQQQTSFTFRDRTELNVYIANYFNHFHHHLPFLHPPSFNPSEVEPSLLLSVLSIGALYKFDEERAYVLHIGSKMLVSEFLSNKESFSSRKCPLWVMQVTLLNSIFASWSGDTKGLEWACSVKSLLANMVAGNRYELKNRSEAREGQQPSHAEWVEDEGCRRTYYAAYIFFGMLTQTYNHTPAISFNEFETIELPSSETLWNLEVTDEESWRCSLTASPTVTVRQAHDSLFQGEPTQYSAFATRVMINALFLEVWYHKRSFEALQDVVTEYKLRLALETWERSLDLCEPETIVVHLQAPTRGHPLIFNAMAVYRNTRARLEVDLKNVQEALRYFESYEVAAAMTNARDKVKRSQEMIKVIQECYNCIEIVALQGIKHIGKTCAMDWSVEHPLCGFDLIVILSLWLYRLEHDEEPATEEELAMYNKVRNLFDEEITAAGIMGNGTGVGGGAGGGGLGGPGNVVGNVVGKLSSTVARLWGSMLDDVVVWGITRSMGEAFKLHAESLFGYDDAVAAGTNISTPTMSSAGGVGAGAGGGIVAGVVTGGGVAPGNGNADLEMRDGGGVGGGGGGGGEQQQQGMY